MKKSLFWCLITFVICNFNIVQAKNYRVTPLDFSKAITTQDLMAAGQLGGLLYPVEDNLSLLSAKRSTVTVSQSTENKSFGMAIEAWNQHRYKDAYKLFGKHVKDFPHSPWVAESLLHQGCEARYEGRMNEAGQTYLNIIANNKNKTSEGAKRLVNKARLRLANLKVLQNDIAGAKDYYRQLSAEGSDWRDRTYASHWLLRLSQLKKDQLSLLDCGTQALSHLLESSGKKQAAQQVLTEKPKKADGFSLQELQTLAKKHDYDLVGIRVRPEELKKVALPAIAQVQWDNGKGHYWLIEGWQDNRLKIYDPQNQDYYEQTLEEFSREWQGALLVFTGTNSSPKLPGEKLALAEMDAITGGCCGLPAPPSNLGPPDNPASCGSDNKGQPGWQVNPINMNFYMSDIPLWYSPAKGSMMEFKLSYNSQTSTNYYEPFGNKWQFNFNTFLVEAPGGNVTVFLPTGKQIIFVSSNGSYTLRKIYKENATLTKLAANQFTLSYSNGIVYTYSIPGGTNSQQVFLTSIKDAHNNQITLSYNSSVQLVGITDADGKTTTLAYNGQQLVSSITDPFGRQALFTYSIDNDLLTITDMGGIKTTLEYDMNKYISSVDYGQGKWTIYTEPSDSNTSAGAYPAPGSPMWANYRITITSPLGNKEEHYYNGYGGYSWHVSPKHYIAYTASKNNYTDAYKTSFSLSNNNGQGVLTQITQPEGDARYFGYDITGNVTSLSDDYGSYSYIYNALHHLLRSTDPNSRITYYTYDTNLEDLTSIKDVRGTVLFGYNAQHDITSVIDRKKNQTLYSYNAYGQLTSMTNPLGIVTRYYYGTNNRLLQVTKAGLTVLRLTYDSRGRVNSETGADGLRLIYSYDNLDRLTRITYPDKKYTALLWSQVRPGMLNKVIFRDGRTATFSYDNEQRLTIEVNAENGSTNYLYSKNGKLLSFTAPNNVVTRFVYDQNDRLINKIYADNSKVVYTSNNSRNLLTHIDNARRMTVDYSYEGMGKLNAVYLTGAENTSLGFSYDSANRLQYRYDDVLGTFTYGYDINDNLLKVDGPQINELITYQYDKLNRRISMKAQGGQTVGYTYDNLGRMTALTVNGQTFQFAYQGNSSLLQTLTRPSGAKTIYTRDSLLRTTQVSNETSAAAVIMRHDYTYNTQDLKDSESITSGVKYLLKTPGIKTHQNNVLNQVIASSPPSRSYRYDADGNLVQGYTPQGYVFTAEYDALNRLRKFHYINGKGIYRHIVYHYGSDGLVGQVDKYNDYTLAESTYLVRDGFLLVQELDVLNNYAVKRQYVWQDAAQGGIGRLLAMIQGGQRYDYLYDDNGNVTMLLDSAQNVVAQYSYSPFGLLQSAVGTMASQPMRFSTKFYDAETGLSDFGYRFYRADVGKWLNRDPIGEEGGINLYEYVESNPSNLVDPDGECPWCVAAIIGGLIGGAMDVGIQLIENHGQWSCIDLKQVGVSALLGAAGSGIGGLPMLTKAGKAGTEFSHWIPARYFRSTSSSYKPWLPNWLKNSPLNGNFTSSLRHYRHDPFRYPSGWRGMGDRLNPVLQQIDRTPDWLKGSVIGGGLGAATN